MQVQFHFSEQIFEQLEQYLKKTNWKIVLPQSPTPELITASELKAKPTTKFLVLASELQMVRFWKHENQEQIIDQVHSPIVEITALRTKEGNWQGRCYANKDFIDFQGQKQKHSLEFSRKTDNLFRWLKKKML